MAMTRCPFAGVPGTLIVLWWANLFIIVSRVRSVAGTIMFIRWIAGLLPGSKKELDAYSLKIDRLLQKAPYLFLARRQGCLIRGFLLYFQGKRGRLDICLHFGSRLENGRFNTHCWIVQQGRIRFEVAEVIQQYTTLLEFD